MNTPNINPRLVPIASPNNLDGGWKNVAEFIDSAILIAFDGCHKMYLAMDEVEAQWFNENYAPATFTGSPEEMYDKLGEWYDQSCGLKFINAVYHDEEDPNAGFIRLIAQFPDEADDWDDEEEE